MTFPKHSSSRRTNCFIKLSLTVKLMSTWNLGNSASLRGKRIPCPSIYPHNLWTDLSFHIKLRVWGGASLSFCWPRTEKDMPLLKCRHAHTELCLLIQQARWSASPVDISKCCGNSPRNTQFSLGSSDVIHNLFKLLFRYHWETCYFWKGKCMPAFDASGQLSEATWGCLWPSDPSVPPHPPEGTIDA